MGFVGNWIFGISIPFFHSHSCSILLAQRISTAIRIGMEHFMTSVCVHCVAGSSVLYAFSMLIKQPFRCLMLLCITCMVCVFLLARIYGCGDLSDFPHVVG